MYKASLIFVIGLVVTQTVTRLTVTNVDKHIRSRKLGREIKVGDVIAIDDTLEMQTPDERATLYSPELKQNFYFNNRFLSKGSHPLWIPAKRPLAGFAPNTHSEFVLALKQNFKPSQIKGVLNGKGGYSENTGEIRQYFSGFMVQEVPMAILGKLDVALDPASFKEAPNKVFVLACDYQGRRINNIMPYITDANGTFALSIDPVQLTVNKQSIDPKACNNFLLLYYDRKTGYTDTIPTPQFVFPDMVQLETACRQFKTALNKSDPSVSKDMKRLVGEFIEQNYGLVDSKNFDAFYLKL